MLISFAVPKGLSKNPSEKRLAVHVEDHPLDYANFEGVIPKGNYGAESVEIYDNGNYMPLNEMDKGLKKGHLKVLLNGKKYKGIWSIVKTNEKNWLIIKSNDQFVSEKDTPPVKTKNPFSKANAQLATLSLEIPKSKDWLFEIKYDGYRILSFLQNGKTKLVTRNGQDYTKKFTNISDSLNKIRCSSCILDGEVVAFDEYGRSDFGLLQKKIKGGNNEFFYVVFDILALDGEDLRTRPLIERKKILERVLANGQQNLIFSSFVEGNGKQSFSLAKKLGLEGIVAKNKNSTYSGTRNTDWLKIKCYKRQEFVIGGFATTDKNPLLSAVLVGYYKKDALIFVGKVGTGFNDSQKKELNKIFKKISTQICPFKDNIFSNKENIFWVEPTLIAEIQFAEMTKNGVLRQPSFVGLREDKTSKDVVLEQS